MAAGIPLARDLGTEGLPRTLSSVFFKSYKIIGAKFGTIRRESSYVRNFYTLLKESFLGDKILFFIRCIFVGICSTIQKILYAHRKSSKGCNLPRWPELRLAIITADWVLCSMWTNHRSLDLQALRQIGCFAPCWRTAGASPCKHYGRLSALLHLDEPPASTLRPGGSFEQSGRSLKI